jgi:7-carboxy-7-deazaguanine synthase
MSNALKVNEIFYSIQGESSFAGLPCLFVRLSGCPLRCTWCDTTYAYEEGVIWQLAELSGHILDQGCNLVELTGGEPLAQAGALELITRLCDAGSTVLIETCGAVDIGPVDQRAHVIMDYKCPSSGMTSRMDIENLGRLAAKDELKLVLAGREDYEHAKQLIMEHDLPGRCALIMSTVFGRLHPRDLAAWILEDRLPVRMQLQMHKYIWPPDMRGV